MSVWGCISEDIAECWRSTPAHVRALLTAGSILALLRVVFRAGGWRRLAARPSGAPGRGLVERSETKPAAQRTYSRTPELTGDDESGGRRATCHAARFRTPTD